MSLGVYIHIPFCSYKCHFCDFVTSPSSEDLQKKYAQVLIYEIENRLKHNSIKPLVSTIFYGGGTPGVFELDHLIAVHNKLLDNIVLNQENEITLETNPETINKEKAKAWLDLGINRLSIGVQSFQDSELNEVGRGHSTAQTISAIKDAAEAGFNNINCDLIYGLPGQDLTSWKKSLSKFILLANEFPQIKHLSAYALEHSTTAPLSKIHPSTSSVYATEEEYIEQYKYLLHSLAEAGFEQYETSNFAKPGYQSKHNINYWEQGEYLAFGVSAHRYLKPYRTANQRILKRYLDNCLQDEACELIDETTRLKEAIMLGLRMTKGIDLKQLKQNFGIDLLKTHSDLIGNLITEQMLLCENDRLKLTAKSHPVANLVIAELL